MSSILDEVAAEVANLSDEEIAAAAAKIDAQRRKQRQSMTEERKAKMKAAEQKRRAVKSAILKLAKEKGLLPQAEAQVAAQG